MIKTALVGAVVFRAAVFSVKSDESPMPDKSRYNLFTPVPPEFMRELTPDRPDKTESPYTVDAGHFQVEIDFANFTHDRTDGVTTRSWNIAPVNFKVGLLKNADLQLVFDNYLHTRTEDKSAGATTVQSGVGDLTARLKLNLWGNDGGATAFGLLPFVKFPTSTGQLGNHAVEGGIIFPLAIKLPHDFDLGLETSVSFLQNESDHRYDEEFFNSVTLGHALVGNLGGYLEFFSSLSTERHAGWVGTVDVGLNYALTKNAQLDCGCNFGVTRAADDLNPFAGITLRF